METSLVALVGDEIYWKDTTLLLASKKRRDLAQAGTRAGAVEPSLVPGVAPSAPPGPRSLPGHRRPPRPGLSAPQLCALSLAPCLVPLPETQRLGLRSQWTVGPGAKGEQCATQPRGSCSEKWALFGSDVEREESESVSC